MFSGGLVVGLGGAYFAGRLLWNEIKERMSLSSPSPLYSQTDDPFKLCPSLVMISCVVDDAKGRMSSDVGFIVKSKEDGYTIVWGPAYFMYESISLKERSEKVLKKGKITVNWNGKIFKGVITYVDYKMDLLIVKFQNPKGEKMPVAEFSTLTSLSPYPEAFMYSLDLTFARRYVVEKYNIVPSVNGCGALHINTGNFYSRRPGVVLDSQLRLVGLKMTACNISNEHAHVLLIDKIDHSLSLSSFRSDDTESCCLLDVQETSNASTSEDFEAAA